MKKLIYSGIVVTMLTSGALYASQNFKSIELTKMQLLNIEALANDTDADYTYEIKEEKEMKIIDDAMGTYEYMKVTSCSGKGNVLC